MKLRRTWQETINQIASRYDVLPTQVSQWKAQLLERLPEAFRKGSRAGPTEEDWKEREAQLFPKIGQLEVERDWLKKNLNSLVCSVEGKRAMIEREHPKVTVSRQCDLLELPRSTAYYQPVGESPKNLELMRRIDEIYTECPFFGARQMTRALKREGYGVNRKRISRLMQLMGLEAQCPKPNLSKPAPGHKVYPYLMKNRVVDGPGQAWCADITYIRLEGGFVYLVAILDWHSRMVLGWSLSNTMDVAFCRQALEQAVRIYGPPKLMNTDQGSQFTSEPWINKLEDFGVEISMDGKGRALDNVFVERLWRTVKYEEVYRREYSDVADARRHLEAYFEFYNHHRPHSALEGHTPAEAHGLAKPLAA